jgi:hypothetical protein
MKILTPLDLKQSASSPDHSVWIVEQLLRTNRQRISLLCGSPHAGKSTIARQLAIAISQGKPFLGRETLKSNVAYWQSEETTEDAGEDFAKSGMRQDDPIVILQPSPADNHMVELDRVLTEDKDIRLVVIQTLDDFLQMDDLSDNPSARRAFERFDREVVSKHKERVCFLALHHFKKSDEQRGPSLTKIQQGKLSQQFACTCKNGDACWIAMKQSAGNSPEGMPVVELIAVRHKEIAMPGHILKEAVHRSDYWLANWPISPKDA